MNDVYERLKEYTNNIIEGKKEAWYKDIKCINDDYKSIKNSIDFILGYLQEKGVAIGFDDLCRCMVKGDMEDDIQYDNNWYTEKEIKEYRSSSYITMSWEEYIRGIYAEFRMESIRRQHKIMYDGFLDNKELFIDKIRYNNEFEYILTYEAALDHHYISYIFQANATFTIAGIKIHSMALALVYDDLSHDDKRLYTEFCANKKLIEINHK